MTRASLLTGLLTLEMACLGLSHGCAGGDMGASKKVLEKVSLSKYAAANGSLEFDIVDGKLKEGRAVYLLNWDLAYWVQGETVHAVNDRARELSPDLPPAPDGITYEAVYDASCDGDHVRLGQRAAQISFEGGELSEKEAGELKHALEARPDDLWARTMLLGYHAKKKYNSDDARREYERHVLWLARNAPASPVMGSPVVELNPVLNPEAYAEAAALMRGHVENEPRNLFLLANAANFFLICENEVAEEILKKCIAIEPDNPRWHQELGFLYSLSVVAGEGSGVADDPDAENARKALASLEQAAALTTEPEEKSSQLTELAEMAFAAGELEKARGYCMKLLAGDGGPGGWNRGNRIHTGNAVLGRIALVEEAVEKAKGHLISAGKCGGSPQLDSFGPDMTLANELLQRGETDAVVEYLELCGTFWNKAATDKWVAAIKRGEKPVLDRYNRE